MSHWRRTTEEGKDYPFAQFNKQLNIESYTEDEYIVHIIIIIFIYYLTHLSINYLSIHSFFLLYYRVVYKIQIGQKKKLIICLNYASNLIIPLYNKVFVISF